jgi:uncharacterized protein
MPVLDPSVWVLIGLAALIAGFIDSSVGGGGMVIVPTLMSALPNALPATILGTNKISGFGGTSTAAIQYIKRIPIKWGLVIPAAIASFTAAVLGAYFVSAIPVVIFKKALPIVLLVLLIYTILNKSLGLKVSKKDAVSVWWGVLCCGLIGFYDGVFGPGAGSFFVLFWVRVYGFDFMQASAYSKIVNVACNAGALVWFLPSVPVFIEMGLLMMLCNITGAYIGAKTTMRLGNGFVRQLLIVVVALLICRTAYDAYFK